MANIQKLRVGEEAEIFKNGRRIIIRRVSTTGFPQFVIVSNQPA